MSDWQFNCKILKERGSEILESGEWSDCNFRVGQGDEQTRFSAHKLFLAMATPVFDRMLNGPIAEQKADILISDVHPKAFKALLEYIYTDKINIGSVQEACDIYYSAKKYMLPHLLIGVVEYLQAHLSPQNVCHIYDFARMYDEVVLLNECKQLIELKTKEVLNDSSFFDADLSTVKQIIGFTPLSIDTELELFIAVEKYCKLHGKPDSEINITTSNNSVDDEPLSEASKKNFKTLIKELRLLSLTPKEFAENVAESKFLTRDISFALLMNIASTKTGIPVPVGFNTLAKQRYKLNSDPASNVDLGLTSDKGRSETTFRFLVKDFAENMSMSLPFYVRNLTWRLAVNPNGKNSTEDQKYIGVYLYSGWINNTVQWCCPVKAEINLISHKSNAVSLLKSIDHIYTSKKNNQGSQVALEFLLDPMNGYIRNDQLTIEVHIVAEEITTTSSTSS